MSDDLGLSAYEVLTTTRSVRKRLDFSRPVERQTILDCIDIAQQAPTGSNSQMWHWVVVTEPKLKTALAELYSETANPYLTAASSGPGFKDGDVRADRAEAVQSSAAYLNEHFAEVPAMVIPCQWGRLPDGADNTSAAGFYGSILPAVWSFMLALRSKGLGSAWTTLHLPKEREAAELLGIPFDRVTQVGLFPVAYTKGTDFKLASRIPAADLVHWDAW
jgi:nitroreductase